MEKDMRIDELKRKEVINTCTCKILGYPNDIEFDMCTGCIKNIVVPGPDKLCGLLCSEYEYIIPFKCIVQIGPDIILVKIDENEVKHKNH